MGMGFTVVIKSGRVSTSAYSRRNLSENSSCKDLPKEYKREHGERAARLSPGNQNVIWKRLSKGTNTPYETECTSLPTSIGA